MSNKLITARDLAAQYCLNKSRIHYYAKIGLLVPDKEMAKITKMMMFDKKQAERTLQRVFNKKKGQTLKNMK